MTVATDASDSGFGKIFGFLQKRVLNLFKYN